VRAENDSFHQSRNRVSKIEPNDISAAALVKLMEYAIGALAKKLAPKQTATIGTQTDPVILFSKAGKRIPMRPA
jgi:hypothetical protein